MKAVSPSGPWGISIRTAKKSIMKVVPRKDGESLKDCLQRAKKAARELKDKYSHRDDIIIEIISRKKAFEKPDDIVIKGNQLWCPYCRKPRRFKAGQEVEIDGITFVSDGRRCVVCGISDRDFYVRTYNHLWPEVRVK